jgi:lysyl-tRNA synthetase, class II
LTEEKVTRLEQITEERLAKLERVRALGLSPYPNRFPRSHTGAEAIQLLETEEAAGQLGQATLTLAGRVTARRGMGKLAFLDLRDGSARIQLMVQKNVLSEAAVAILEDLDIGDFIGASGTLSRTRTGEPTLMAADLTLLAKSLLPLPEKWHGLTDIDIRHRQRYLDLIANPAVKDAFELRSRIISATRRHLDGRGFIEVETPVLQPAAGGATARPFVTRHEALDQDFFLRIALELHLKRLVVGGFDRVYEIGRIFRNEGLSTRHNPEFTMMECYEAYADYEDVMRTLENMVAAVCDEALGGRQVEYDGVTLDFTPPWPRVPLRQAVAGYSGIDYADFPDAASLGQAMAAAGMEVDPKKSRGKLIDQLIGDYVEPAISQPTFLVDYPLDMSPLAKSKPDDPDTVERFEAICGGMEIANAFTELNDPVEQESRFQAQMKEKAAGDAEVPEIDHDFVTALRYGMPPTGGLGVGIDRLVMLLSGQTSIREVILFPQLRDKP